MLRCLFTIVLLSFVCILVAESPAGVDREDNVDDEDNDDDEYVQPVPITMSKVLIGRNKIKLQWDWPTVKPTHFIIQYNNNSIQVDENWVLLTNLLPYTNYSVEVLACMPTCISAFGPEVYRTKMGIPGQVDNFDLRQANATHVLLSWDAPLVPAGPNQFYKVRFVDSDSMIELNTSATNMLLPRPVCETGGSSTSQKVSVRGVSVDPEAKTTEYYGNASSSVILYVDCLWESNKELARVFKVDKMVISKTSIKLWWKAAKNDSYYLITYNNQSAQVSSTSFALTNLTPNTMYTIQVSACHADGNCSVSTVPIGVRTKPGVPDKVENLGVTKVNSTTFLVSWQPPSTKYGPELFYRVRIQSSAMGERTFDTDQSEALIQTPDCKVEESNANYTAVVTAVNPNDGVELIGESLNATIFVACARFKVLPPQLPHIDHIDIGSTWIELKWSLPSISVDTYYLVEFNSSTVRVMDSQFIQQELAPNTSYMVQLHLCIENCTSFFGPARIQTKALIPISVRNLRIVDVNSTHFWFNWQPPLALAESNFTYQVALGELEVITDTTHFARTKPICESEDLLLTASVKLAHFNHSFYTSESVSITVPYPCLELQSTFTRVLTHNSTILLEWTPVDTGNPESVYKISYNGTGIIVNDTTIQLENLEPSTVYNIQVAICIADKCNTLTKPLTVRTQPSQPIPEKPLVMELLNSSHALLSWTQNFAKNNESCSYSVQFKFSNSSLYTTATDLPSQMIALPTCDDTYPPSSSYVIEVIGNRKLCGQSDYISQPPVMSVFQQTFGIEEIINDWDLPVYVDKVVVLPTTIELEWNGTDLGEYLVLCNQSASNVLLPQIRLTDLMPDSDYSVEIFKCNNESCNTSAVAPFTIHTPPQMVRVQNVTFIGIGPQILNITWQPPGSWQPSDSISWQYHVLVSVDSIKSIESFEVKPFVIMKLHKFDSQLEVVARITPYSPENLNLVGQETVASIWLQAAPKAFINQIEVRSKKITVTWSDFSVNSDSVYLIKCNETISTWSNDSSMSATISDLVPDTVYSMQLLKCNQDGCGQLIGSSVVRTQQSVHPLLEVEDLQVQTMNSTYVHLNWSAPQDTEANSSNFVYDVRLVQTIQTNDTNVYLLNRCQSVLWPESYEIAVQAAGQLSTWKTIEVRCQPDPVSDTYYKSQSFPAINILIFVAFAGFVVGAAVYACTCRTFTYTYKVKGGHT